jgi:2-amino-4-hydroxy-6-hydroxymethyldihydropteridine diphosphokinase
MWFAWRTATGGAEEAAARVWLGLGSNLGDRAQHLAAAIGALRRCVALDALSGVYETQPYGYLEQPVFWNMALRGRTALAPHELLAAVKALEPELGRVASFPMGPRAIDIDVLLYDDVIIRSEELTVPHAGVLERPFVLAPLLELDEDLRHPVTGEKLADRAAALGMTGVRRIGRAADVLPLELTDASG